MLSRINMNAMADEFRKIAAAKEPEQPTPQSRRLTWEHGSAFITPGGSMVHGTPHKGTGAEEDSFIETRLIPDLLHHAEGALRGGKTVVCLTEGGVHGPENTEQRALSDAMDELHRKPEHAGKVLHDTWDDDEVRAVAQNRDGHLYIDRSSPMFKKLVAVFKDPDLVDAALQAGLSGQGKGQTARILASAEAQSKLLSMGVPPTNVKKLHELTHPHESGGQRTQLSAVMEHYHHHRRQNLVKKVKEHEGKGHVVVTAPAHLHVKHVSDALRL